MFEITGRQKSDLKPTDIIEKLGATIKDLCAIPGINKKRDSLFVSANHDSTMLFGIYLRSILNSKNVIMNERLNS